MDEQLKKLKTKATVILVLSLLSLTWQFLNYLTIKKYIPFDEFWNIEFVMIIVGYIFFLILFIGIVSLVFTSFRVSIKYNSEKKKSEKDKAKLNSEKINNPKF